jgi:hypothetical protein
MLIKIRANPKDAIIKPIVIILAPKLLAYKGKTTVFNPSPKSANAIVESIAINKDFVDLSELLIKVLFFGIFLFNFYL